MNEHPLPIEDLERLRSGLQVVLQHMESRDISDTYRTLSPEIRYSPLTQEVSGLFDMVDGHIQEYAILKYEDERETEQAAPQEDQQESGDLIVDMTTEDTDGLAE